MNSVLLFNPRSAVAKHRVPNSIMNIAASIEGRRSWTIVDGNREPFPYQKISSCLASGQFRYIGFTVMPGPQTRQAIDFSRQIKEDFPATVVIWGGYFATSHYKVILEAGYVDYVITGPGDRAFPALIDALEQCRSLDGVKNLAYREGNAIVRTAREDLLEQDELPPLPYDKLDRLYPMEGYLGRTYLGQRTLAYHSSIGCPFTCSFCAVVPTYQARWKAKSATHVYQDIKYIKDKWGADAIEFHDNNFFVSEKRAVAFSKLILPEKMKWWGMARIDTMDRFKDESLALISDAGCKMIFFGAESGDDTVLKQLDKGGTQSGEQILKFAERLATYDIIPEYSFVLGTPAASASEVMNRIEFDIRFIRKLKRINPKTEIVLYTYSPVPAEGSALFDEVLQSGFSFPQKLEDWASPRWEKFDLRKNPLTPWLAPGMVDRIRNFETVLNGYYPTVSDLRLNHLRRKLLRIVSGVRYKTGFYHYPYEIKLLHRLWKYRQPEIQGL